MEKFIDQRAQDVFGLSPEYGFPVQFLWYGLNNSESVPEAAGYRVHTDCDLLSRRAFDRTITLLVYLNDVAPGAGGRTCFPSVPNTDKDGPLCIRPEKGLALVFRSDTGPVITKDDSDDEYEVQFVCCNGHSLRAELIGRCGSFFLLLL